MTKNTKILVTLLLDNHVYYELIQHREGNIGYRKVQSHDLEVCILDNYVNNEVVSELIIAASIIVSIFF